MRPFVRSTFFVFFAAGAFFAAAGCSGRDVGRDAGEQARALVRVDLSFTRVPGGEPRFDAQAHFVRYRAFDPAGVPTLLGFTDFDGISLDACRVSDGTAELDEALSADGTARGIPAEVALLDAGRLDLRGPIDRATLMPHHYPELVPFVSGVIYGGDETRGVALGLGQSYQVTSEGGEEVGPFVASAVAPRAFPVLTVEPLHRGGDLEVRWADPPVEPGAEPLLVEVKWTGRAGARAVRCRVRDDGELSIPHDLLDAQLTTATVTATRIARSPLTAPGAGRGELTVSLRDLAPLQVLGP
jgi:hypothetical protein